MKCYLLLTLYITLMGATPMWGRSETPWPGPAWYAMLYSSNPTAIRLHAALLIFLHGLGSFTSVHSEGYQRKLLTLNLKQKKKGRHGRDMGCYYHYRLQCCFYPEAVIHVVLCQHQLFISHLLLNVAFWRWMIVIDWLKLYLPPCLPTSYLYIYLCWKLLVISTDYLTYQPS